jgi:hypothetical protein
MPGNKPARLTEHSEYLYQILREIEARPGMFLGQCSITRLRSFLDGYRSARADLGLPITEQERAFAGFQAWLQLKFQVTSSHGWDSIISLQSSDEQAALRLFFQLLQQFQQDQTIAPHSPDVPLHQAS